jgi:uncharacterized protein (DUF488 family)
MPAHNPDESSPRPGIFTIGHSSRTLAEFLGLLAESGIRALVDVRSFPGSRAYPHFNSEALAESLAHAGVDYAHAPQLGGRRKAVLPSDDLRNAMWRNKSFRYYADYALSPAFAAALDDLEARAARQRCAVMCAEAVWWRCHRRIIADHLLARGHPVYHIMGPSKVEAATLTPDARTNDGVVTYPPPADLF